jgi:hypothetical protein
MGGIFIVVSALPGAFRFPPFAARGAFDQVFFLGLKVIGIGGGAWRRVRYVSTLTIASKNHNVMARICGP